MDDELQPPKTVGYNLLIHAQLQRRFKKNAYEIRVWISVDK